MRLFICLLFVACLSYNSPALAFMKSAACGAGKCADCHTLTKAEAKKIIKDIEGEVLSVNFADVPGLWRIEMKTEERVIPLYLDFSKTYLISGNVIRLADRKNLTEQRLHELNPIDQSTIPTADALLLGNPKAKTRIIVFTDPHCPYCSKLHQTIKQAVAKRPDLLFLIKMMPIKQSSLQIAKTIVCNHSLKMLDEAFAGKTISVSNCGTPVIEQTLTLTRELGIRATPTMILPNGQIATGYKSLEKLLELIDQNTASTSTTTAAETKK